MFRGMKISLRVVSLLIVAIAALVIPVMGAMSIGAGACSTLLKAYPLAMGSDCNGAFSPNGDTRKENAFFNASGTSAGVSAHVIVYDAIATDKIYARIKLIETSTGTYDSDFNKNGVADDINVNAVIEAGETGWGGLSTTGYSMPNADGMMIRIGVCGGLVGDPTTDYRCVDSTSDALVPAIESVNTLFESYITIDNIAPINMDFSFTPDPSSVDASVSITYQEPVSYAITSLLDDWLPYPPVPSSEDPRLSLTQQINGSQSLTLDVENFDNQIAGGATIDARSGDTPAADGPFNNDITFVRNNGTGLYDGLASMDVRAVDFAGNIALDSTTFLIDTTGPTISAADTTPDFIGATYDYVPNEFVIDGTIDDNPNGPDGDNAPNDEVVGLNTTLNYTVTQYNFGTSSFDIPVTSGPLAIDFTSARSDQVNGTWSTGTVDAFVDWGVSCGALIRVALTATDALGNESNVTTTDLVVDSQAPVATDLVADPISARNDFPVYFAANISDNPCVAETFASNLMGSNEYITTSVVGYESPVLMTPVVTSVDAYGNGSYEATITFTGAPDSAALESATIDAIDNIENSSSTLFTSVFDIDTSGPAISEPNNLHSNATNNGNWASPDINTYYFTDEVPGAGQAQTSWAHATDDISARVIDVGLEGVLDVTIDLTAAGLSATEPMIDESTAAYDWNHDGTTSSDVYGIQETLGLVVGFPCGLNDYTITANDNAAGTNSSTYDTEFLYDCAFPTGGIEIPTSASGDLNVFDDGNVVWIGNGGLSSVTLTGTAMDDQVAEADSGVNTVNAYILVNGVVVDTQTNIALDSQTYQAPRSLNGGNEVYPDATAMPNGETLSARWSFTTTALGAFAGDAGTQVIERIEVVDNAGNIQFVDQQFVINNEAPVITDGIHLLDQAQQPADYVSLDLGNYASDADNASTDVWYSASVDTNAVAITSGPDGVIDTTAVGDDVQVYPVTTSIGADMVGVAAGANGVVDAVASNDDVVISLALDTVELNPPTTWGYPQTSMTDEVTAATDWDQDGPAESQIFGADISIPHGMPAIMATGTYSASVEAEDTLGNSSNFDPISLDVDNEDPTISEPMVLQRDDTEDYYISDQSGSTSSPSDTNAYLSVRVNDPTVSTITSGVLEVSVVLPAAEFDGSVIGSVQEFAGAIDLDRDGDQDTETYRLVDEVTAGTDWNESGGLESDVYGLQIDTDGMALDGLQEFTVTATDTAQYPDGTKGNYRDDTNGGVPIQFIVDSTAPNANLVQPADGTYITTMSPTTFSGIVSDDVTGQLDSGIRSLEIFANDGEGASSLGFASLEPTATQDARLIAGSNDPTGPVVSLSYPQDSLGADEVIRANWSLNTSALVGLACSNNGLPLTFDITADLIDNAGNLDAAVFLGTVTVECTQPGLNVANPTNGSYVSTVNTGNIATIDGYANDTLSGVYRVQYSLDAGVTWTDVTNSPFLTHPNSVYWFLNWDTTGLPDGSYNFLFRAIDFAQNEQLAGGYVSWTVKLDNTLPSSKISTPLDNTATSADEINVTGTAKDTNGSGVAMVEVLVDGSPVDVDGGTSNWTYMLDATALSDGAHTLESRATDLAGNVQSVLPLKTIWIDNGAPLVNIESISPNPSSIGQVTVTASADDIATEIVSLSLTSSIGNGVCTGPVGITYTCTIDVNNSSQNGNVTLTATATDAAGNVAIDTDNLTVDTMAPTGTVLINDNDEYTSDSSVTLMIEDAVGDMTEVRFKNEDGAWDDWTATNGTFEWDLTAGDGQKTVFAQFRDALNNTSGEVSDTIVVDTEEPLVNIVSPEDGSVTNASSITITGNASDPESSGSNAASGINRVMVTVDDGDPEDATGKDSWSFNCSACSSAGSHTVVVVAFDNAGNISNTALTTFTVDNTAPSFSIGISPTTSGLGNVVLTVTASEALMATPDVAVNSQSANCASVAGLVYTCTYNVTTSTGNGTAYVSVSGRDLAGNVGSAASSFTVDTAGPTGAVTINSNAENTNDDDVTLNLTATDDITVVAEMRFKNETGAWSAYEAYSDSKAWILTAGDGVKTVYAQFKDSVGNESAIVSDTITLDTVEPNVAITYPVDDAFVDVNGPGSEVAIIGTANDVTSGIDHVDVEICPVGGGDCDSGVAVGDDPWSFTWSVTAEGSYDITVEATDKAGNSTTSDMSVNVTFDGTGPIFSINSIDPLFASTLGAVTIDFSVDEVLNGTPSVLVNGQPAVVTSGPIFNAGTNMWDYEASYQVNNGSGEGIATVMISGVDMAGNTGQTSGQFVIDLTDPLLLTIDVPLEGAQIGGNLVTISGTATDEVTEVALVDVSIDGAAYATADGTDNWSYDWTDLSLGDHQVVVRVTDIAGNSVSQTRGFTVSFINFEDSDSEVVYSGLWSTVNHVLATNGTAAISNLTGSAAGMTFTGSGVTIVSAKGPMMGKADILLDGNVVTTVNLYASSLQAQKNVYNTNFGVSGSHTIAIRVKGTKSTQSSNTFVVLDMIQIR